MYVGVSSIVYKDKIVHISIISGYFVLKEYVKDGGTFQVLQVYLGQYR
jgi:hypothetical protein